jgi:hypothetical protein
MDKPAAPNISIALVWAIYSATSVMRHTIGLLKELTPDDRIAHRVALLALSEATVELGQAILSKDDDEVPAQQPAAAPISEVV